MRLAVLVLVSLSAAPVALAQDEPVKKDEVAGGTHWRFALQDQGAVHVWRPKNYDPDTAGIVVYVHGYYTDVDTAWTDHELAKQFRDSRQNALFIVPEAPTKGGESVRWTSLGDLIRSVRRETKLVRPWGHIVVVAHSGAYRTVANWLDYKHLDHLVLLDALYGYTEEFEQWYEAKGDRHKLIVVGGDTLRWTEPFVEQLGGGTTLDAIPDSYADIGKAARKSRLLYMRAQYDHMALVTNGKVIPLLLRLTRLTQLQTE